MFSTIYFGKSKFQSAEKKYFFIAQLPLANCYMPDSNQLYVK